VKAKELIDSQPEFSTPSEFWKWAKLNINWETWDYAEYNTIKELVEKHKNVLALATDEPSRRKVAAFLIFFYYPCTWSSRSLSAVMCTILDLAMGKITEEQAEGPHKDGGKFKWNHDRYLDFYCGSGFEGYNYFSNYKNNSEYLKEFLDKVLKEDLKDNNEISKPDQKQIDYVNHIYKD